MSAVQATPSIPSNRFASFTDPMIADAYGTAVATEKAAEVEKDSLKTEFIRRKLWSAEGQTFVVTRSETPSERLDTTKIRTEMGEDWCKTRSKTLVSIALRASRKDIAETASELAPQIEAEPVRSASKRRQSTK